MVIAKDDAKQTPEGQMVLDFNDAAAPTKPPPVSDSDRLFFQALELQEEGEWARAALIYENLLHISGQTADTLVNLGSCYFQQAAYDRAEDVFRRALHQEPDHVEANFNLANLLTSRGELEKAVEWRHIFKLRTSKAAHPQIRELMLDCLVGFKREIPILFDDLPEWGEKQ